MVYLAFLALITILVIRLYNKEFKEERAARVVINIVFVAVTLFTAFILRKNSAGPVEIYYIPVLLICIFGNPVFKKISEHFKASLSRSTKKTREYVLFDKNDPDNNYIGLIFGICICTVSLIIVLGDYSEEPLAAVYTTLVFSWLFVLGLSLGMFNLMHVMAAR